MNPTSLEILSAFIDGENVEPARLVEALSTQGAAEALRDFARMRSEIANDDSRPGAGFYARTAELLDEPPARAWWRLPVPVPAPLLAAMLLAVVALGVWSVTARRELDPSGPPRPDRVLRFEPEVEWDAVSHLFADPDNRNTEKEI